MNRLYQWIVPAAVLTTVSRHIITALQLEGVVMKGWVWDVVLVLLALAFAALEGVALVQIEEAMPRATDAERKRLGYVRLAIYIAIPATFIAPLVAQAQGVKLSELLAGVPIAMWVIAGLNVAAPMFVISGSATALAILRDKARKDAQASAQGGAHPKPVSGASDVTVRKRDMPQLTASAPEAAQAPTAGTTGKIDGATLAAMLAANPKASSTELAQAFGVSPSAIRQTREWEARK